MNISQKSLHIIITEFLEECVQGDVKIFFKKSMVRIPEK